MDIKNYYVNNDELIEELRKFKLTCEYNDKGKYVMGSGDISENLGKMIWSIADGLSHKANFRGYTWRRDMVQYGVLLCLKYCHNFDPDNSKNAFSYITMICYRAFIQYIEKEKKHGKMKNKLYDNKPSYWLDQDFYSTIGLDYETIVAWENKEEE